MTSSVHLSKREAEQVTTCLGFVHASITHKRARGDIEIAIHHIVDTCQLPLPDSPEWRATRLALYWYCRASSLVFAVWPRAVSDSEIIRVNELGALLHRAGM